MNPLEPNFSGSVKPEQALEEFLGEQFIEWLQNFVATAVRGWPELAAIRGSKPKIEKIRKFMLQRFLAAEAFLGSSGDPGFLGFALANLSESDDPQAESALEILEKKRQSELTGKIRPDWIVLLRALGISDEDIKRTEPKEPTRNYIAELSDIYSNSDWQTAMGAFAGHEMALPEEYQALLEMLTKNSEASVQDAAILKSRQEAVDYKYPVNSAQVLDKIVFDQENKNLVWDGVKRQLAARHDFYKGLLKYLES